MWQLQGVMEDGIKGGTLERIMLKSARKASHKPKLPQSSYSEIDELFPILPGKSKVRSSSAMDSEPIWSLIAPISRSLL
jgi:hypothetical protein